MWEREEIEEAIREHRAAATKSLAAVQFGVPMPLTVDSLRAAANVLHIGLEELWVDQLVRLGEVDRFAESLRAQGVPLDAPPPEVFDDHVDLDKLGLFAPQAKAFRCLVRVNGQVAGTGCLIGPSLVLTAWHVVAVNPPRLPQMPTPQVEVILSDQSKQDVIVPFGFESFCGDAEFEGYAPRADSDVIDRNDVALLVMRRPAAAHLGYARLPSTVREVASRSTVFLVHFPDGDDKGVGVGKISKIRRVTARWRHDICSLHGSSGVRVSTGTCSSPACTRADGAAVGGSSRCRGSSPTCVLWSRRTLRRVRSGPSTARRTGLSSSAGTCSSKRSRRPAARAAESAVCASNAATSTPAPRVWPSLMRSSPSC